MLAPSSNEVRFAIKPMAKMYVNLVGEKCGGHKLCAAEAAKRNISTFAAAVRG